MTGLSPATLYHLQEGRKLRTKQPQASPNQSTEMFKEYLLCAELPSSLGEIPEEWKTQTTPCESKLSLALSSKLLVQCHLVEEQNTVNYDN